MVVGVRALFRATKIRKHFAENERESNGSKVKRPEQTQDFVVCIAEALHLYIDLWVPALQDELKILAHWGSNVSVQHVPRVEMSHLSI